MKIRPQCCKVEGGRRCPDSAAFIVVARLPGNGGVGDLVQLTGGVCRKHSRGLDPTSQQRLALGTARQTIRI
jgi:hypothetical protein